MRSHSVLTMFVVFLINAAVSKAQVKYTGKYGQYELVDVCARDPDGECSEPNSCCNKANAHKIYKRYCKGPGPCNPNFNQELKRPCKIQCVNPFPGKYGPWKDVSGCARKPTGQCAGPNSCCKIANAVRKQVRVCKGPGACDPDIPHERDQPCKVKCVKPHTGKWSGWKQVGKCARRLTGECSADNSCCKIANAVKTYTRTCKGPGTCDPGADTTRTRPCKVKCEKQFTGRWGPWITKACERADTGSCSGRNTCCKSKFNAVKISFKKCFGKGPCDPSIPHENDRPCKVTCEDKAEWGAWATTGCVGTCGTGVQTYKRECQPGYGNCWGDAERTEACTLASCSIDGGFSDWSDWSTCSVTCGGLQTRSRTCTNPAPAKGGADCVGDAVESRPCNIDPCPPPSCEKDIYIDLLFVNDESTSVGADNYVKSKNFLRDVAHHLKAKLNSGAVRMGAISYSSDDGGHGGKANLEIPLATYNFNNVVSKVDALPYRKGGTYIGYGINFGVGEFNARSQYDRKVMVVITDGISSDDVGGPANAARLAGISVLAVGVGEDDNGDTTYDIGQLREIAGYDTAKMFEVTDYAELVKYVYDTTDAVCKP